MTHKLSVYYAGYSSCTPAMYFNKVLLISALAENKDPEIQNIFNEEFQKLKEETPKITAVMKTALEIADTFNVPTIPKPRVPDEYFEWLTTYTDGFKNKFPMPLIEYFYFRYGCKIADLLSDVALIKLSAELTIRSNGKLNFKKQIQSCLNTIPTTVFDLGGSAAGISRTDAPHFHQLFLQITDKKKELEKLDALNASNENLTEIISKTEEFRLLVYNGFVKGTELLEKDNRIGSNEKEKTAQRSTPINTTSIHDSDKAKEIKAKKNLAKKQAKLQLLSLLCVLTWIGSALAVILALYGLKSVEASYAIIEDFNSSLADMKEFSSISNPLITSYENRYAICFISIVCAVICSIGAIYMWKQKRIGFYIYALGEIVPVVAGFIVGGGLLGSVSALFALLVAILFTSLYAINLKHLK